MNPNEEVDSIIEAAFREAEAGIDLNDFIVKVEIRRKKRHMVKTLAMAMAVATGACMTLLFANDAISDLSRRLAFAPDSPAGILACVLPLAVVGVVVDALFIQTHCRRRSIPRDSTASPHRGGTDRRP